MEDLSVTQFASENTTDKQSSTDRSFSSDTPTNDLTFSDNSKVQKKPLKTSKQTKSINWQDRAQSSKVIDTLVGDSLQGALLKEVFFPISEDDLKGGRKKRSLPKQIIEKLEYKNPVNLKENKNLLDLINDRLVSSEEASIKKQSIQLESLKKQDLIGLIQNYEKALNYKTKFQDVENLNMKDIMREEFLSNLELTILQRKAEVKNLFLTIDKYKTLKNTVMINKLFKDFISVYGNSGTKLKAEELLNMKKELDEMGYELKKLHESELRFYNSMIDECDLNKATTVLKKEIINTLGKTAVKRAAPLKQKVDKPVKKQKKSQKPTKEDILLAEQEKKRKDYEHEVAENYLDLKLSNISVEHPLFYTDVDGIKSSDIKIINYYDVLGKTTLSSNSRNLSANVEVIVSALFPDITEKYIIHSSANIGTKDNFSIDSLMVIYDLMQLNNIIYFNRKNKQLNDLIYAFYAGLCIRSKSSKVDVFKITSFADMINQYNNFLKTTSLSPNEMLKNANSLYIREELPTYMCNFICNYVYGRIVIPEAKKLSQYVGFSDKTYGELLPDFLSMVFDKCQLDYNSNFVDLGCGIGNTNYFASVFSNVASTFGCEIMENPSVLCVKYGDYFKKVIKLFGINNHTDFKFSLKKSFIDNDEVVDKLKSCDVLLLNNFIFSGDINIEATSLVNNLPIGSKVIHLKPLMTMNKAAENKVTKSRIDYNLNKKQENYVLIDENNLKTSINEAEKNQTLKDEDLDEFIRDIRNSLRIRNTDGSINDNLNKDSDNLVEVTKLVLDDKMLISFKFAMPSGDMVSWTSDNACYNFYISRVVDIAKLS